MTPADQPNVQRNGQSAAEAIEAIELPLLLEAMFQRYGYDFRDYAMASLKRRVRRAMQAEELSTISSFQERILHDPECMARFLDVVSVDVSAMFRDPSFYQALRAKAVPALGRLPHSRLWVAGCASGEEVYSLAILLHEEGLLQKSQIYATDINLHVIERAREAIFPLGQMREYTANYQKAGRQGRFLAILHSQARQRVSPCAPAPGAGGAACRA